MTTTASRFLSITRSGQNLNTQSGFTVHVLDYKNFKSLVAVISEYEALSFTEQLNDPGVGSITLDEDDPAWGTILNNRQSKRGIIDKQYVFEIHDRDQPRFAFMPQTISSGIGEGETRSITISGPGIAAVLRWACILRPGWPTKVPIVARKPSQANPAKSYPIYRVNSYNDKLPAFLWRFPIRWPSMRMWWTVFKAAQRRGLLGWVTPAFTAYSDTNQRPWIDVTTIDEVAEREGYQPPEPAMNLLDFLADCTGQDYSQWFGQRLEWLMKPGFRLEVRRGFGTDRSDRVRFFQGSIVNATRTRDRENIYNRLVVTDVDGNEVNVSDGSSIARWNIREQRNETHKNVTDKKMVSYIADRLLIQQKDEKDEWTIKVPYDVSGRVPYLHYFPGDEVGVNWEFNGTTPYSAAPNKLRIMAITISISADTTVPDVELTLQSLIDSKMQEIEKQITRLINNPVGVKLSDIKDTTGLITVKEEGSEKTLVYNPETRKWEAADTSTLGGGGGGSVHIQKADPSTTGTVSPGDFWLETYD